MLRERRNVHRTTPSRRDPSPTAEEGQELRARQGDPRMTGLRGCLVGRGTSQRPRLSVLRPRGRGLGRGVASK